MSSVRLIEDTIKELRENQLEKSLRYIRRARLIYKLKNLQPHLELGYSSFSHYMRSIFPEISAPEVSKSHKIIEIFNEFDDKKLAEAGIEKLYILCTRKKGMSLDAMIEYAKRKNLAEIKANE